MKLKCVSSLDIGTDNPSFIKGNEYEVMDMTDDGRYYVVSEKGNKMYLPLNGKIWRFRIVRDKQEDKQEQEDIIFEIGNLIKQLNHEFDKLKNLM